MTNYFTYREKVNAIESALACVEAAHETLKFLDPNHPRKATVYCDCDLHKTHAVLAQMKVHQRHKMNSQYTIGLNDRLAASIKRVDNAHFSQLVRGKFKGEAE